MTKFCLHPSPEHIRSNNKLQRVKYPCIISRRPMLQTRLSFRSLLIFSHVGPYPRFLGCRIYPSSRFFCYKALSVYGAHDGGQGSQISLHLSHQVDRGLLEVYRYALGNPYEITCAREETPSPKKV